MRRPQLVHSDLVRAARDRFGISPLTPGLMEMVRSSVSGRDVVGIVSSTQSKRVGFELAAHFLARTIVVVPTPRRNGIPEMGATFDGARALLGEPKSDLELMYVTARRMRDPGTVQALRGAGISLLVVDEADRISEESSRFTEDYLQLRDAVRWLGGTPVLALTEAREPAVTEDIIARLDLSDPAVALVGMCGDRDIAFETREVVDEAERCARLLEALRDADGCAFVYTSNLGSAEAMHKFLVDNGISAGIVNGRQPRAERNETQSLFERGDLRVLVTTHMFAQGLEKPGVHLVVHTDFSDSLVSYYEDALHCGRDGKPSRALLLYTKEEADAQRSARREEVRAVVDYADTSRCRVAFLHEYFRENAIEDCGACDNCRATTAH